MPNIDKTKLTPLERSVRNAQITTIPAGATPKYVSVQLPGADGSIVPAWYTGAPAGLAVDDYVRLSWTPGETPQYEITGVSGGTGTASVILANIIEAVGDLIVGTGAGTVDNLAVGTDGYVLTADSGEALGVAWAAAGGGGSVWPNVNKVNIGTTEYSTIGAAITAASAGDNLYAQGSFTENVTLNKAIRLVGLGQGAFSITGTVDVSDAGAVFENCTVTGTVTISAGATIRRIIATGSGGTDARGISVTGNNARLYDCQGTASGGSSTNRGLYVSGTGVKDFRGNYSSSGSGAVDIYADGVSLVCIDTVTTNIGTTSGTVYGTLRPSASGFLNVPSNSQMIFDSGSQLILVGSGGTSQYVKQTTVNGALSVGVIAAADLPAETNAFTVVNGSGAAVAAGDVGYLNNAGQLLTSTTSGTFVGTEVAVVTGGNNGATVYVKKTGKITLNYAGSAPNSGDFLIQSTTAGKVVTNGTTMHPGLLAIATAAGSGGVVEAVLFLNTQWIKAGNATRLYGCALHSNTDFVATINGAPSATSVVYNAPSAGNEDVIKPQAAGQLGKAVLWNSTRNTSRLIDDVNTGTNTITTVSSVDAWANGDTVTIASQTVTSGVTDKFIEIDLSQQTAVPILARSVVLMISKGDSSAVGQVTNIHPNSTYAPTLQEFLSNQTTTVRNYAKLEALLIGRRFVYRSVASGTGTATDLFDLAGYFIATL